MLRRGPLGVDLLQRHHQLGLEPEHLADHSGQDRLADVVVESVTKHPDVRK